MAQADVATPRHRFPPALASGSRAAACVSRDERLGSCRQVPVSDTRPWPERTWRRRDTAFLQRLRPAAGPPRAYLVTNDFARADRSRCQTPGPVPVGHAAVADLA